MLWCPLAHSSTSSCSMAMPNLLYTEAHRHIHCLIRPFPWQNREGFDLEKIIQDNFYFFKTWMETVQKVESFLINFSFLLSLTFLFKFMLSFFSLLLFFTLIWSFPFTFLLLNLLSLLFCIIVHFYFYFLCHMHWNKKKKVNSRLDTLS